MSGPCSVCGGPYDSREVGSSIVRQRHAGEERIEVFYLCATCTARQRTLEMPSSATPPGPAAPESIPRFRGER